MTCSGIWSLQNNKFTLGLDFKAAVNGLGSRRPSCSSEPDQQISELLMISFRQAAKGTRLTATAVAFGYSCKS